MKHIIMGINTTTHKKLYYNVLDSKWVEDETKATIFNDYNEGLRWWFIASKPPISRGMRVVLPNAKGGENYD